MTPGAWYEARIAQWTDTRDRANDVATRLSRLRLATFLGGVALVWWAVRTAGTERAVAAVLATAAFVAFAVLVIRHARVLNDVERAETALRLNAQGLARLARDWHALTDVTAPPGLDYDAHPYARDLDLFGHASLAKWLGPAATIEGTARLYDWLLNSTDAAAVAGRQTAIEDLAARGEWRERLAIEGALTQARPEELRRFLDWAEGRDLAMPPSGRTQAHTAREPWGRSCSRDGGGGGA